MERSTTGGTEVGPRMARAHASAAATMASRRSSSAAASSHIATSGHMVMPSGDQFRCIFVRSRGHGRKRLARVQSCREIGPHKSRRSVLRTTRRIADTESSRAGIAVASQCSHTGSQESWSGIYRSVSCAGAAFVKRCPECETCVVCEGNSGKQHQTSFP